MIDLRPEHLAIVQQIVRNYVPGAELLVFGSRVTGSAKPHSDLDLAVRTDGIIPLKTMALLQNAFRESDLPFRVDVLDWHDISVEFQELIAVRNEILQSR